MYDAAIMQAVAQTVGALVALAIADVSYVFLDLSELVVLPVLSLPSKALCASELPPDNVFTESGYVSRVVRPRIPTQSTVDLRPFGML